MELYGGNNRDMYARAVELGLYMVEKKATVRAAAGHFGISKSTVHKDITEKLKHADAALYAEVSSLLEQNKNERHIRGGNATRLKYRETGNRKSKKRAKKRSTKRY